MEIENEHKTILVVEDSPEDFAATERGLRRAGLKNPIAHCVDGDDALDYLHRRGAYAEQKPPRPAVVLLDLNLPGTDGREVLADVKSNDGLKVIPVIVLTTSSDERDIQACYQMGANTYVHKPVHLENFFEALARLKGYWLEVAILPQSESQ